MREVQALISAWPYVFLQDGTHLNAEIIRQGYGFAVSSSPPLKYQNEFRRLEHEAREQRWGLWTVNP
jgi:micrococcal nuclease